MKKIFYKPLIWIIFVFVVALFFRFFKLTTYPVSYSMDEVAIGVNAYSILNTAKDEHGVFMPLAFKSVGDYKPPINIYLTVISEFIIGFNEFAVRFPSAFLGSLTCVVVILLLRSLKISWKGSVFGGFWLAVLPWHIHFSRGSFEAVTALFFLIAGVWLFVKWVEEKRLIQILSWVTFFSLSVWAYHAERFFVPILMTFLIVIYWKEIKIKNKQIQKQIIIASIVFLLFAIPFLKLAIFTPAIAQRAAVTSILREQSLITSLHSGNYENLTQKLFDNDTFLIFRHWAGKYLNYFDLRFWFWKGMQFTPSGYLDMGIMYAVDLPLFFYGIYSLIKSKNKLLKTISLFWFFAGPISASMTMNEQHPLRAMTWLPFFGIVMAMGAERFIEKAKRKWIGLIYFAAIIVNIIYFGDTYLRQFPRHFSEYWQYGYKQIAQFTCDNLNNYDKIFISDTFGSLGPLNTGVPPLYVLFYCKEARDAFLWTGKPLDKIQFRRPNIDSASEKGKLLLIGSTWDFLDGNLYGGKIIKKIVYPNGVDAFLFVEK